MPKEVIADPHIYADGKTSPLAVEVSWGTKDLVQLASINKLAERYTPEAGFYVDLDRPMINRLIKVLRRARDQAYGADE